MRNLIVLGLIVALFSLGARRAERLSGSVLFSFSESHYLVQTATHVFRIRRDGLGEKEAMLLKNVGSSVVVSIPRESIDMAWRFADSHSGPVTSAVRVDSALADEFVSRGNMLQMKGRPMASFEEAHYLVRSGGYVYRIKQGDVDNAAKQKLASVGTQVQFQIPAKSIDFAWAVDNGGGIRARIPSSQKTGDEFRRVGETVFIRGRLLPSLTAPHFLIQAGQHVYMIQQSNASKAEQAMLSKVGSQVSVSVPAEKVEMSWPIEP